jgi:hypothetical protein
MRGGGAEISPARKEFLIVLLLFSILYEGIIGLDVKKCPLLQSNFKKIINNCSAVEKQCSMIKTVKENNDFATQKISQSRPV